MPMLMLHPLILLVILTAVIAYMATAWAAKRSFLSDQVTMRSNHRGRASRAGGLIILCIGSVAAIMANMIGLLSTTPIFFVIALCGGILGLIDDRVTLPALPKLLVLLVLSVMMVLGEGAIRDLPVPGLGWVELPGMLAFAVSIFFVLAFTNAFNFMDGLNGMASSHGIIGLGVGLYLLGDALTGAGGLIVIAAGALLGFGARNILFGRIFLGDAGSLAIGMGLSGLALAAGAQDPAHFYLFALSFTPYLLDTGLTLLRRWREGKSLFESHCEHHYQKLRDHTYSHQAIAGLYALLSLFCAAVGIALEAQFGVLGIWIAMPVCVSITAGGVGGAFRLAQNRRMADDVAKSSSKPRSDVSGNADDKAAAARAA